MTLNAREAMQALLDGKTLRYDPKNVCYKLDEDGDLVCTSNGVQNILTIWTLSDLEIYDEYPLTFEQALRAMLDGKIVRSDLYPLLQQRFYEGCFESSEGGTEWQYTHLAHSEQKAKWKVVE